MLAYHKVKLMSSDSAMFEVDKLVASQSETVKNIIEDVGTYIVIPLPNVESKVLAKVVEFCKYHVESGKSSNDKPTIPEDDIKQWEAEFVKVVLDTLFNLIVAADNLNIKNLLGLTCRTVAYMIKSKTHKEIRKAFNIKNDFTPDLEEKIRQV